MSKISKKLLSLAIVLAMVLSMTPAISFQAAAESEAGEEVAARVYSFDENWAPDAEGYAWCQACYEQAKATKGSELTQEEALEAAWVQWEAFTGGEPTKDKHYYLNENFENYSASTRFMDQKSAGTYCWNLNGKTVTMATTTTEALCRVTTGGVLNIMDAKGTGVLAGYEFGTSGKNGGAAVEVRNNGIVNIYGGNFRRTEGSSANVAVGCHTSPTGQINIYGGTIDGVYTRTGLSIKLAGAPVITDLTVATNVFANIDGLTDGAQITVEGSVGDILTDASDNAAAAAEWFTSTSSKRYVDVNDAGQLVVAARQDAVWDENAFTTGFNPRATTGNKAYCEACYKQAKADADAAGTTLTQDEIDAAALKTWTVFTGGSAEKDKHYYLTANFENYGASTRFMSATNVSKVCWNLNGHSVTMATTSTEPLTRADRTTLNIMDAKGTGVLTGYKNNSSAGTSGGNVVEAYQSGVVNIYGGTFLRSTAEGASGKVAIGSRSGSKVFSGAINIYGGTIDGVFIRATDQTTLPNYLSGAPKITGLSVGSNATVNIDGLTDGAQISVAGDAGKVISAPSANAVAVKDCFTADEGLDVDVNSQNQLYIPAYAVVTGDAENLAYTWCENWEAALDAHNDSNYIGVWAKDANLTLTKDAYVAAMQTGVNPTVTVSGDGITLYAMDTTQDDYTGTPNQWTVTEDVEIVRDVTNPVTNFRYLNVSHPAHNEDGEVVGKCIVSYRFDLKLSHVTLRAQTDEGNGIYYKSQITMSDALADCVRTYGVVLSANDMPGTDFASEESEVKQNSFTAIQGSPKLDEATHSVTVNSGALVGVMKKSYVDLPTEYPTIEKYNAYRGDIKLFANAYLLMDLDGDGDADEYVMAITDDAIVGNRMLGNSMHGVMDKIDTDWDNYTEEKQGIVNAFYSEWSSYGMDAWTFQNIGK